VNEDSLLITAMAALGPTPNQVARLQGGIEARLEREQVSLAAEWLELLRRRPLAHGGLVLAAACALLLTTPLGALLWSLLGASLHG
jgi:hypothetical protein